jgi:formyl-CoA transferase
MAALEGMKILDLTQFEAGTSCTQHLAWLGAEVVKVEPPDTGDPGRYIQASPDGNCLYFLSHNANKRGIALDLRSDEGRQLFLELVKKSDVVVENFALGTMERMGLGYDVLRAANPRIIYGSIKGFGRTGPYSAFKAFDPVAQAAGGADSVTGYAGQPPVRPGAFYGDTGSGIMLALAILAAYVQQVRTGEGQVVEVSMQEAVSTFMRTNLSYRVNDEDVQPRGNLASRFYPCAPGGPNDYVTMSMLRDTMWDRFCVAIGRPELSIDERFITAEDRRDNAILLEQEITAWTMQHTKFEVMEALGPVGVPVSAVFDTQDLLEHPHLTGRGSVTEMSHPTAGTWKFLSAPFRLSNSFVPMHRSPLLGEHTEEVLRDKLVLSSEQIADLIARGVVQSANELGRAEVAAR